jgi:hypothetical protein
MQCATHPDVETELACGRCEKPICPKCMYQTPGGQRCRECANLKKLPQYEVGLSYLARAAGASLVVGVVAGMIWGIIPFGLLGILLGIGAGYACGEAVSIVTNRKAGTQLQVIASVGVVVAFVVRASILASALRGWEIEDIFLNDIYGYLALGLGIVVAVGRLR